VSCGAVLPCGDGGAAAMPEGDVLGDGGEPERVGLPALCCGVLLPVCWDDERDAVFLQCGLLLPCWDVGWIAFQLWL
jgi:hypothetical protein